MEKFFLHLPDGATIALRCSAVDAMPEYVTRIQPPVSLLVTDVNYEESCVHGCCMTNMIVRQQCHDCGPTEREPNMFL